MLQTPPSFTGSINQEVFHQSQIGPAWNLHRPGSRHHEVGVSKLGVCGGTKTGGISPLLVTIAARCWAASMNLARSIVFALAGVPTVNTVGR